MKKILALLLAVLLLAASSGCGSKSAYQKFSYEFFSFDTVIQIMGYNKTEAEFNAWSKKAETRFNELNQLYDMYKDYAGVSNIKTINDNAGVKAVKVAPEIINLIKFSKDWYHKTPGLINIALGAVLSVWHNYREAGIADPVNAQLPPMAELQAAMAHTDINKVIVDEKNSTVYLQDSKMSIDVGSVAKGYATELVAQELKAQGWQSFIINSGGNVRAVGKPLDGIRSKWGVGITDPNNPGSDTTSGAILDTAFVADKSVTTAGDYQRYYIVNGKRYHHIIDPQTLMPGTNFRSVTVVTQDSGEADFLDTLLFLMTYDQGVAYIKTLSGVDALWILPDGTMKATDGMKAMLKGMGGATSK